MRKISPANLVLLALVPALAHADDKPPQSALGVTQLSNDQAPKAK